MIVQIRKLLALINPENRWQVFGLLFLFLLMAFTEVLGIASILPFMSVLANPESIHSNEWLKKGYDFFSFNSTTEYLFFIGIAVFVVLLISNLVKSATRYATLVATQSWGENLAKRLFGIYLQQPYSFFLQRNSSELSKNILAEVNGITSNVIMAFLDLITKLVVCCVILVFLAIMDPILAIGTGLVLGGAYLVIFTFFRKSLRKESLRRTQAMGEKYKVVNEGILGIKNIKLGGYENLYNQYFSIPAHNFAKSTAKSNVVGEIPRYALELLAFGGILLMLLYLLSQGEKSLSDALPVIAVYVFAAYRLMPGFQGIYYSFTKLRFNKPVLDLITRELSFEKTMQAISKDGLSSPISFEREITLKNVSFQYGPDRKILNSINLDIPAKTIVGIVGKTGAGKTTMVDIILGLLRPTTGKMMVDNQEVTDDKIFSWQQNLSYVSQHIYLCDDTITANIAFGQNLKDVDIERVKAAAKMADIHDFIEKDLSEGYATIIGENGIRLSGGQRQRIGIARALYLDRPVLVLDEATSALDPETESQVMKSIHALERKKTIFIICHKYELLAQCDIILVVKNGSVTKMNVGKSQFKNTESFKSALLAHIGLENTMEESHNVE